MVYSEMKLQGLITLLALLAIGFSWSSYPDIRTGTVVIINGGPVTAASVPISYNITYSGALSQTTSCGIGIVGFQTLLTNDFSVNVTIINFQVATMRITALALDDTIVTYLSVNYIAVGAITYFLEVQFYCFLPSVLSVGNGTRTETRTSTSFFVNKILQCNVYLSGFRVHNSQGLVNYLKADVACPANTSNLNYVFTAEENNTVLQICYTTVIFCQACTQIEYYDWGQTGQDWLNNQAVPTAVPINVNGRYTDSDRGFWGMSAFNISRGQDRKWKFDSDYWNGGGSGLDSNYQTNTGTYSIRLDHFFIAVRGCNISNQEWFVVPTQTCVNHENCPNGLAYTLNSTARYCNSCYYTCDTCGLGALDLNCTSCSATVYRYLETNNSCPCQPGYIDIGVTLCYPCEYYMPGCYTCITTSLCSSCFPGFTLNSAGVCQCTSGFLVTGVCTTITGCTSATNLQGQVFCLACNASLFYVRTTNFTCVCMTGYTQNVVMGCVTNCGDGVKTSSEACDDNNTASGDGCSSTCTVETNWFCDTSVQPSVCYVTTNVTGQIKYVRRVLDSNTAEFGIKLSPYFSYFEYMNFATYLKTDMPCSRVTTKYSGGLLIVSCDYTQTVETNFYTLNLTLDSKFFSNTSKITITLPASGMNAKLTYDNNYSMTYPLEIIVIILDVIAIIVMFITSITERMIGVEMIQTLQSVLYAMALMKTCPSTLEPLQFLRYSNGYNELAGKDYTRTYPLTFSSTEVGLEQEFLLSYNLSYILLFGVIVFMLILKGILMKNQRNKELKEKEFRREFLMDSLHPSHKTVKKVYKFVFERIFFLMAFMNMFLVVFAGSNQLSNQRPDYLGLVPEFNLLMAGIALFIMGTFLAMVIVNAIYPRHNIFPMFMHKSYPFYYTVYVSTFIVLLSFLFSQTWMIFALMGLTGLNLIVLIAYKPYPETVHNLTIIYDQIVILLALAVYLYEAMNPKTDNNEFVMTIAVILLIVLLYICVGLSIYRLYRYRLYMKQNELSYNDPDDVDKSQYEKMKTPKETEMNDVSILGKTYGNGNNNGKGKYGNGNGDGQLASNRRPLNKSSSPKANNRNNNNNNKSNDFEESYFEDMKQSNIRNPLNTTKQMNEVPETRRDNKVNSKPNKPLDESNYDTFNKTGNSASNKPKSFQIDRIDPKAKEVKPQSFNSPYDEYGNVKLHNIKDEEDEDYDALKAIKAKLRKDFYQKVHGVDYKPPVDLDGPADPANDKQFLPDDYDEEG